MRQHNLLKVLSLDLAIPSLLGAALAIFKPWYNFGNDFTLFFASTEILSGFLFGLALGILIFLTQHVLRPNAVHRWGSVLEFIFESFILFPLLLLGFLSVREILFPDLALSRNFWQQAETWILILGIFSIYLFYCAVTLLLKQKHLDFNYKQEYKESEGFLLVLELVEPKDNTLSLDTEKKIKLSLLLQKLCHKYGISHFSKTILNSGEALAYFIPGRHLKTKRHIVPLLAALLHYLNKHSRSLYIEYGFIPRLAFCLHFGDLAYAHSIFKNAGIIAKSSDLQLCEKALEKAKTQKDSFWITESALQKITLPVEFHIAGSFSAKAPQGTKTSRIFYLYSPIAQN